VGWAIGEQMSVELVLAALNMALQQRKPDGVIHHMGVRPSMGTVGDACDNAMAESFFATLECELIDRRAWQTKTEARLAMFTYSEGWYNPRRRHSALGQISPAALESRNREHAIPTAGVCVAGATVDIAARLWAPEPDQHVALDSARLQFNDYGNSFDQHRTNSARAEATGFSTRCIYFGFIKFVDTLAMAWRWPSHAREALIHQPPGAELSFM
jgi:hypothetical protein